MTRRTREVWVTDRRSGERSRRPVARFDVRYRVDGHDFRYGFEQRGWADTFARQLQEGFARGLLFDPTARRFIEVPTNPTPHTESGPSVIEHFTDYAHRKWRTWEPATRPHAQRDLARAALFLVRDDAPPMDGSSARAADAFLRSMLSPAIPSGDDGPASQWGPWFSEWSLPLTAVTDAHLQDFLQDVATRTLDGRIRHLAPTSIARTRAVVRAAFTYARKRRLIAWDPWDPVQTPSTRDADKVNPDLVMTPSQVRALARACAVIEPRAELYVLLQGFCGLRPGEAGELRRRDLEQREGRIVAVTARASYSAVPERFLDPGESRRRPLKGRGPRASRTVPVPQQLSHVAMHHLGTYVSPGASAYVFTTASGTRLNASNFQRDVWRPARRAVFGTEDALAGVRRHDLRHAAITAWLNAGVPLKTAQAWSGHRTASVLLDTYLGVMRGDEDLATAKFEALLDRDEDEIS